MNKYIFLIQIMFLCSIYTFSQNTVKINYVQDLDYSKDKVLQELKNERDTSKIALGFDDGFTKIQLLIYFNDSLVYNNSLESDNHSGYTGVGFLLKKKHPCNLLIIKDRNENILLKQFLGNDYYNISVSKANNDWVINFNNNIIIYD